jgi:REP element-mobilizing transposase RayT
MLGSARRRDLFLTVLEQMRRRYQFVVLGYVVMPEHFHLLISEPQERTPSTVMQALKLGFARRMLIQMCRRRQAAQPELFERTPQHIWQKRLNQTTPLPAVLLPTSRKEREKWATPIVHDFEEVGHPPVVDLA